MIKSTERQKPNSQEKELEVIIDNGDLQALKDVMSQFKFVDEEALLRYALVALLNSSDNKLYVKKEGNILAVKVSENLIKKDDAEAAST